MTIGKEWNLDQEKKGILCMLGIIRISYHVQGRSPAIHEARP